MYTINDVVCYQNYGICQIIDIKSLTVMNNKPRKYYFLRQMFDKCDSTIIKIPVDTNNIMRQVISKEDALKLIESLPEVESVWVKDVRDRELLFKTLISSWKMEEWVKVIKSIYIMRKENRESDKPKPLPIVDMKNLEKADSLFNQEMAYALELNENEIPDYIGNMIENKANA